jgi:HSP20 family protein
MEQLFSLGGFIRPHHIMLDDHGSTKNRPMRLIGQMINDPWYSGSDGRHHRRGLEIESGSATSFDVRESKSFWFLEGEFPGVSNQESIHIEYIGSRTLVIEAQTSRLDEKAEWGGVLGDAVSEEEFGGNSAEVAQARADGWEHGIRERVYERRTGLLQKSFTFPQDVDIDRVKARLNSGLLKLLVPKRASGEKEPTRRIPVE